MIKKIIFLLDKELIRFYSIESKASYQFAQNKDIIQKTFNEKIILKYWYYGLTFFWIRFIWRGKAFRVRLKKRKQRYILNFGHSHMTRIKYNNKKYFSFKVDRQNYIFIFKKYSQNNECKDVLKSVKTMNRYTKRGLRIKNYPYIRRFGKISQVNSILHSYR